MAQQVPLNQWELAPPRRLKYKSLPQNIQNEFLASLDKLKEELPEALEYKVVHKKPVTLRPTPSLHADEVGRLQPGDSVRGWPVGSWLFVKESKGPLPDDGAWTLLDGSMVGIGNFLMPEWSKLTVLESSANQMSLSWPGINIPGMVYYLQWMPLGGKEHRDGGVTITAQPTDRKQSVSAIVSGLPLLHEVTVRPIVKLQGGLLVGESQVFVTAAEEETTPVTPPATVLEAEQLEEESKKFKVILQQISKARNDIAGVPDYKDIVHQMFKGMPKGEDKSIQAKQFVWGMLYGAEGLEGDPGKIVKEKGKAEAGEGAVQSMFGEATAGYEEGASGVMNEVLAQCIATLIRKHA